MKKKILDIIKKKNKSKIVSLTAYSKNIASILDNYCDIILVGDSLGSVLYNYKSTRKVSLKTMIEHSKSVRIGIKKSLMVVDMPHNTYRNTKEVFDDLVVSLKSKEKSLTSLLKNEVENVELEFKSNGLFDVQLKFAGDTLLFHMHSNIFDFPPTHEIFKSKYINSDKTRSFCGVINIYNFLSDSLKYNR